MREIIVHGRGGSGGVLAATLLAQAALYRSDDNTAQSFPKFGAERRGAPVKSFCRIGHGSIKRHSQIYSGDIVVVLDDSLLDKFDPIKEVKKGGVMVINTTKPPKIEGKEFNVFCVDATGIALDHDLKISGNAIVNTTMLGAVVKSIEKIDGMDQLLDLESIRKAITNKFKGEMGERNANSASKAFQETKEA